MTKKEYILQALGLFPNREMGRGIKTMVENNQLNDHAINLLVIILKKGVDQLQEAVTKYKMKETIDTVDKFKKKQEKQAKQDQEDLNNLDSLLANV